MSVRAFGGKMQDRELPAWPGIRSRLGAFALDSLALGLTGAFVGMFAFDQLAALGDRARLLGLLLTLLYFGILCSRVGRGQSLGMKLLKIRVVDSEGKDLGLTRSFGRALVLSAPFLLNGIRLNGYQSIADQMSITAVSTVIFGVGLAQAFLLFFNRPSRRLLHDLLFRSSVVWADHQIPEMRAASKLSRASYAIVAATFLVAIAATMRSTPETTPLTNLQDAVQTLPEVGGATATNTTSVFVQGGTAPVTRRTLVVSARLRSWPSDASAEVTRVGKRVVAAYAVEPGQQLWITLSYGYSIGIASGYRAYAAFYEPGGHPRLIRPLLPQSVGVNPAVITVPKPDLATCSVPIPSRIHFRWPKRVAMTSQSMWTFERYNKNGYGTMIVIAHYDGTVRALIAPTPDIDAHLHAALADFAKRIAFAPQSKCSAGFATFLVYFAVPSGTTSAVQFHPPSRNMTPQQA
jgi:uncharacterized RDD family membrane protein YckC